MKTFKYRAAQGEITVRRLNGAPDMTGFTTVAAINGQLVVSHSESGHNHYFPDDGTVELLERPISNGLKMLYAIVKAPTELRQSAAVPHDALRHEPGVYQIRLAREFDPFAEQVRLVAD